MTMQSGDAPHTRFRRPDRNDIIPPAVTRAMLALVLVSLTLVAYARLTDRPLVGQPAPSSVVEAREIRLFADRGPGMRVTDAATGAVLFENANGGFITAVHTALRHNRARHDLATDLPVRLASYENGRLVLHDDLTGWAVELADFGSDGRAAFARLLAD
jgi:putative photosynthetic complex assembly protein